MKKILIFFVIFFLNINFVLGSDSFDSFHNALIKGSKLGLVNRLIQEQEGRYEEIYKMLKIYNVDLLDTQNFNNEIDKAKNFCNAINYFLDPILTNILKNAESISNKTKQNEYIERMNKYFFTEIPNYWEAHIVCNDLFMTLTEKEIQQDRDNVAKIILILVMDSNYGNENNEKEVLKKIEKNISTIQIN